MSVLKKIIKVEENAKKQIANVGSISPVQIEEVGRDCQNMVYMGDNLKYMKWILNNGYAEKFKLIYIDPPFFSESGYDAVINIGNEKIRHRAYDDKWNKNTYSYLRQLTSSLMLIKELLSDDGLIWLHLDWHIVHYAKVLMDEIFGMSHMVNEIIWQYKSGGSSKRRFSRKHDNLLVYSKTNKYTFHPLKEKSYNRQFKPYRFNGVREYKDDLGWYTMVNMKDVWNIDMVGRTSNERTGYATQKPEMLLERIIDSSTSEGDLCGDFFCGSGTLPAVAAAKGRKFIACDRERLAIETTLGRIYQKGSGVRVFASKGDVAPYSSRMYTDYENADTGNNEIAKNKLCPSDNIEKCNYVDRQKVLCKSGMNNYENNQHFSAGIYITEYEIGDSEKKILNVSVGDIHVGRLPNCMSEDAKNKIHEKSRTAPLSLIASWSIDTNYDGRVHRPKRLFFRHGGKLTASCQELVEADYAISVKIVDILGRVYYTSFA